MWWPPGCGRRGPSPGSCKGSSGDYRNFFEQDGRRYSHHIDPRTGESVAHRLTSVTVVMPGGPVSAMSADGLATALVVMGEEKGPALAESLGLAAFFILREGDALRELGSAAFGRL
jgi:thiamine biosynthesis lipoprotein